MECREQRQLVANYLFQQGFLTSIYENGVLVSLKRKVSKMEVFSALQQEFDGIEFQLEQLGDEVLVK